MNTRKLFNGLVVLIFLLPTLLTGSPMSAQAAPVPPYALNGTKATDPGMSLSGLSAVSSSVVQSQPVAPRWPPGWANESDLASRLAGGQVPLDSAGILTAQSDGTWRNYTDGNEVRDLAVEGDYVWAATEGGVVRWNRTDGSYVKYTTWNSGLASNIVFAVTIDGEGHKWFGTYRGGVSEFDGTTWTTYTTADGLAGDGVFAVTIDEAGHKWFGTDGGVSEFDGSTWTTYTTADGLADNDVWAIAIDGAGHKWFGFAYQGDGVSEFDGSTWTTYTTADGLAHNWVHAIAIDGAGHKWFGTEGGGVSEFDGTTWTTYTTTHGLANNYVEAIAIDGAGHRWFGTGGGVSEFDGSTWTTYTTADGLAHNQVHAITIDGAGHKWFGTQGGVSEFDGTTWTTHVTTDGLAGNQVHAITIDGAGHKWFGANGGGVSEFDGTTWVIYTEVDGLVSYNVWTIAIDGTGHKWFGTDGGVSEFDGTTWTTHATADGLADDRVWAIAVDETGHKWFGTESGVSEFDGVTWTAYTTADGLAHDWVWAIAIDGAGHKWFGTEGGGVSEFDGDTWTTYTTADGLAHDRVWAIVVDEAGHKWFGTEGGVSEFDGSTWTTYTEADGLAGNYVYAIAIDGAGHKWFGTEGGGVSEFDGNTWTTYTENDGLVDPRVYAIAIDEAGHKWFGTYVGVSEFIPAAPVLYINTVGNGDVIKTPDQVTYTYGTVVTLTATADPHWTFAGWSGDLTGSANPVAIVMDGGKVVTATFTQDEYTLTVNTVGSGSVDANPPGPHHYDDVVTLTANADPGWSFAGWSGDLSGATNPITLTVDGDKSVTAVFTEDEYALTINRVGSGSITKDPDQATYRYGDVVTLTAIADLGWSFAGWSGDLSGSTTPIAVTMDGDKNVTALFTEDEYALDANIIGDGSVTKNPDQAIYRYGDVVTLTAAADSGWTFNEWSGDLTGSTSPITITMDGDKTVIAIFTQDKHTLTINRIGSGSVIKDPDQATYYYGEVVTLTAVADPGWSFAGWSGDLTGSANPETITMDGNKTVTADFTQDEYTLMVNTVGSGSVTKEPDQATYLYGDVVTLTATADLGWRFDHWSGDLSGSANPDIITMDSDKTVTVTFTIINPAPFLTSLSPVSATAGGPAFILIVNGTNFIVSSTVRWNGAPRTTTFVSSAQLLADITTADIATTGVANVNVVNHAPGGGTSNALPFAINNHGTAITVTLLPVSKTITASQSVTYTTWATDTYGNGWDATAEAAYAIDAGAGGSWAGDTYTSASAGAWTVTSTVDGVDDTATLTVEHGPATTVILSPASATIAAGQSVTYTVWAIDTFGNSWDVTPEASYVIDGGAGGSWADNVYTSQFAGTWTVTAIVDGVSDTASLVVNPVNDPPVAVNDAYSVDEGDTLTEAAPGVLDNDSDADNDPLVAIKVTDPTHGTLTLNTDGSFTYVHDGTETTSDSFTYEANDGSDDSNVATVNITVNPVNDAPVADAGPDQNVQINETVTLDGSASYDPDGHLPLIYGWAQTGGPLVALSDDTAVAPTFTAPDVPTVLTFTLTVTDSAGLTDPTPDEVVVTVEDVPIAGLTAGNSSPTTLGQPIYLTVTVSAGSNVTYRWAFGDGDTGSGDTTSHTYSAAGNYTAVVTASNGAGEVSATTPVTITNEPPVAHAGPGQSVMVNKTVTLDGSGSYDPDSHLPLAYGWAQTGGPTVGSGQWSVVSFTFTTPGTPAVLTFTLTVTDAYGLAGAPDTVVITVEPAPCTTLEEVSIGGPTSGYTGTLYTFTSVITPSDATTPITYTWSPEPEGGQGTANAAYRWTTPGTYTLTLTAENCGGLVSATHAITVTAAGGDAYEPDDTCEQARPISTGAAVQSHDFHQQGDADWVSFDAVAGTTYVVETSNVGLDANTTLELFDQCGGPPQDFDDDAFGTTSRISFDCPTSGAYYVEVANHDPAVFGAGATYDLAVYTDTLSPPPPRNLQAEPGNGSVALQWRPNDEPDVTGYRLHYGATPGVYTITVDIPGPDTAAYILEGLTNGVTYYLALTALDFGGHESIYSAEVSATPDPAADTTEPSVVIQTPTATGDFTTTLTSLLITGTCSDGGGNLNYVELINAANGERGWDYGPEGGSDVFLVGGLPLEMGANQIVATVFDTAGNLNTGRITIQRVEREGAAIIVAGHNAGYGSQQNIYNLTNRAYRLFLQAGFSRGHVYYLSPEPQDADGDGSSDVDDTSTPAHLEEAITVWAADEVGPDVPLFIYLMDHGIEDYFCADGCEESGVVWADDLNDWLTTLENATGANEINVIVEACHSGSFVDHALGVSGPGRVAVASTSRNLRAFSSIEGAIFSDVFWTALEGGADLNTAFVQATAAVSASVGLCEQPWCQWPWLDDDGDATPNDAGDGALAATRYLMPASGGQQPTVLEAGAASSGAFGLDLTARVAAGDGKVETVWAAIYPPSWAPPETEPGETPEDGADLVRLSDPDGDGVYTGSYSLDEWGEYRVLFHVQDVDGSLAAPGGVSVSPNCEVYLPLVVRNYTTFPLHIGDAISQRDVAYQGEVFYTRSVWIPERLPAGGHFYFSSQRDTVAEVLVDDELAVLLDGSQVFTYTFATAGSSPRPAVVEVERATMEQLAGRTVTVEYRDVYGVVVEASAMWLIWTP